MRYVSFRKLGVPGVPDFGVLIVRILLFGVFCEGPLFSETTICKQFTFLRRFLLQKLTSALLAPCGLLLGGSWLLRIGVISGVTILITLIRGLM